jgi:hypothetical protein
MWEKVEFKETPLMMWGNPKFKETPLMMWGNPKFKKKGPTSGPFVKFYLKVWFYWCAATIKSAIWRENSTGFSMGKPSAKRAWL